MHLTDPDRGFLGGDGIVGGPVPISVGVGFALWGFVSRRESYDVTAAIVIMIVAPVTATALVARGIVGIYQRRLWQGSAAIIGGVALFAAVVIAMGAVPLRGDAQAQW